MKREGEYFLSHITAIKYCHYGLLSHHTPKTKCIFLFKPFLYRKEASVFPFALPARENRVHLDCTSPKLNSAMEANSKFSTLPWHI